MKDKQIKVGALLSYASIGVNILVGLLYTPWMVEQIGESDYGLYTLSNSLIALFLFDFGLSAATSRFVSKYVAEGRHEQVNSFLGSVYKLYLFIDVVLCVIFVIFYFVLDHIYVSFSPEELQKFKVVYCIVAGFSVLNFPSVPLKGILTAYEKFIQLKSVDIIHRILSVSLTVFALYNGMGLYALVAVNSVSGLLMLAYKYLLVRKFTPAKATFSVSEKQIYKTIFSFSLWSTIGLLAQRLIINITPSILGIVSDSAQIAVFGIVTTIEGYCYMITAAINGMFMPKISRIYASDSTGESLFPLMVKVGRFQFFLNGLLVVGFAVLGRSFIRLWMGESFLNSYFGILLVIIPGLFYNSLQVAKTAMVVQNKVKEQAYISVICGVLNVAISLIMSSRYGAIGACVSICFAYCVKTIMYHIVLHRSMNIDIIGFIKACYFKMLPSIVLALLCGFAMTACIPDFGWISFIVKGIILVCIYLGLLFCVGLNKEERKSLVHGFGIYIKSSKV